MPADFRFTLQQLRGIIRRLAPGATERVNYQTPLFRLEQEFVGISAAKVHCALHTFSKDLVDSRADELKAAGLRYSGGTIHCKPGTDWPLPLLEQVLRAAGGTGCQHLNCLEENLHPASRAVTLFTKTFS